MEFDYTEAIPDLAFMENDRNQLPGSCTRTVAAMHAAPYTETVQQQYRPRFPTLPENLSFAPALSGRAHA